jgi:hypothetical protein
VILFIIASCFVFVLSDDSNSQCGGSDSGKECINQEAEGESGDDDYYDDDEPTQPALSACGLYLAQSTIPNSGLGVFAGVSHDVGSIIAPPEIAHQILFELKDKSKKTKFESVAKLVYQYLWNAYVTGGLAEGERVESLIPGLGMAANSFLPMINSRSVVGMIDSAGINAGDAANMGPGSGAFTAYHNTIYLATTFIQAGEEIFVDYGDAYFRGREAKYGMIPLVPEFERADEMLTVLWGAMQATRNIKELFEGGEDIQNELQILWHAIRDAFVDDERVRNALPSLIEDVPRASMHGTANNFLRYENPRSLDWLEKNGYCMDTLEVRNSKIPQAGRGAFAKHSFKTGETILPLPMIQMTRAALHITKGNTFHSHQLILNYCFGHKDSSLLLYPYSSTSNFVNHGGKKANTKVVWASEKDDPTGVHNEAWLSRSPRNIMRHEHTGLIMLLVASRDIEEGEEVTIDYGPGENITMTNIPSSFIA